MTSATAVAAWRPPFALPDAEVADVSFVMRVPNPGRGRPISVELSLPGLREVTVELLDVAGRRLKSVRVAPRAPAHTVVLGTGVGLAPGVYVVRVTRGAESLTGRAVVIR